MSKFKPLPKEARKREITEAGDRSILSIILATITESQRRYEAIPGIVWIDQEDCHLLAKELKAGAMSGDLITREGIEARIKAGMLTLFGGVRIGVARQA